MISAIEICLWAIAASAITLSLAELIGKKHRFNVVAPTWFLAFVSTRCVNAIDGNQLGGVGRAEMYFFIAFSLALIVIEIAWKRRLENSWIGFVSLPGITFSLLSEGRPASTLTSFLVATFILGSTSVICLRARLMFQKSSNTNKKANHGYPDTIAD